MSRPRSPNLSGFAAALSDALEAHVQNLNGQSGGNLHRLVLSAAEEELMKFAIRKCGGNVSEAARMLGISRTTLARKLNGFAADAGNRAKPPKPQKPQSRRTRAK